MIKSNKEVRLEAELAIAREKFRKQVKKVRRRRVGEAEVEKVISAFPQRLPSIERKGGEK